MTNTFIFPKIPLTWQDIITTMSDYKKDIKIEIDTIEVYTEWASHMNTFGKTLIQADRLDKSDLKPAQIEIDLEILYDLLKNRLYELNKLYERIEAMEVL